MSRILSLPQSLRIVQPVLTGNAGPKNLERAGREGYHVQIHSGARVENYLAGLEASGRSLEQMNVGYWAPPLHVVATNAEIPAEREFARKLAEERAKEYTAQRVAI